MSTKPSTATAGICWPIYYGDAGKRSVLIEANRAVYRSTGHTAAGLSSGMNRPYCRLSMMVLLMRTCRREAPAAITS
ncbi:MAG: hypothetical protein U5K75_02260 [Ahrensia sp.]|nr:hypothetical protein [Ahrensia sp.]